MTKELASRIEQNIHRIGYDFEDFTIDHFIKHIEQITRRDIILQSYPLSSQISGIWVKAQTANYIIYNDNHHPTYQNHIILHEIAHIMLGHQPKPLINVLPELMGVGLFRTYLVDDQSVEEIEAETWVNLLHSQIMKNGRFSMLLKQSTTVSALEPFITGMSIDL